MVPFTQSQTKTSLLGSAILSLNALDYTSPIRYFTTPAMSTIQIALASVFYVIPPISVFGAHRVTSSLKNDFHT